MAIIKAHNGTAWEPLVVGGRGPEGPYGGTSVTDPQVASYLLDPTATRAAADGRYLGQGTLAVSTDTYGTAGDGATDDTAAMQAALDSGARFVYVPTGIYRINAPLLVPANTVFYTFSATLVSDAPGLEAFIKVAGSYAGAKQRELAADANAGDRTLTTKTAHDYQPGDILRLVSQRISTNPDDAGEDQLGWATGSGSTGTGPFFSEFVRVQNVTDTTLTLDTGLLFNGYRPDGAQETDPAAGTSAYLADTNGAGDNALVFGFRLEGEASYGVRVIRAKNVRIRDIEWTRALSGRFIQFLDCYYSDAERCYIETRQWTEPDTEGGVDHAAINQYHVVGSWHTGFTNCRSVRGTQPYDFTYALSTAPYPSAFCYVRNSTAEGNLFNPVTAHPGTYGIVVEGNVFSECQRSGISIRSNGAQVTQNIVRGSGVGIGMYVTEGGGKESLFNANTVEGFERGLVVNDGGGKIFLGWIGVTFSNNYVLNCEIGYSRSAAWERPLPTGPGGVLLVGNAFVSDLPGAIGVETSRLGRPTWGLTVQGNSFRLPEGSNAYAVVVANNSRGVSVLGNTMWNVGRALHRDESGATHEWGEPCVTEYTGNVVHRVSTANVPASTENWRFLSRDPEAHLAPSPHLDYYTETSRISTGTNAEVSTDAGFPVDGLPVIVSTVRRSGSMVFQYVEASTGDMHFRRRSGSSWGAWSKRY